MAAEPTGKRHVRFDGNAFFQAASITEETEADPFLQGDRMINAFAPMAAEDREAVIDIFNHYIENSFAAYPARRLPYEAFGMLLNMCQGYPNATVRIEGSEIAGFGMLRPYSPISSFSSTAEISYFIKPGQTGRGIGKSLLEHLIEGARAKGITSILASISSLKEGSIRFHARNGFVECGRFAGIGLKNGRRFDVVYYQRNL